LCPGLHRSILPAFRLLARLFHAERVEYQFELREDLGGMARDVGAHRLVGKKLSKLTLGNDEVQKSRVGTAVEN